MTLRQSLKRGDWIRAKHKDGGKIVGQAGHDVFWGGSAMMYIKVASDTMVGINVNFWDVKIIKKNVLPSQK